MKRSNYQFFLNAPLSSVGSSVAISTLIGTGEVVSLTDETSMTIGYENRKSVERIKWTATGGVLTITERWLTNAEAPTEDSSLKLAWRPWAIVTVTLHPDDIAEADAAETITWDWTFSGDIVHTGTVKVPVYADATARDAAITSPSNGMLIYNTALGVLQQYIGGAWADVDAGSTPNASETVAGKVEIATTAEFTAGSGTWGTGAQLVSPPNIIQASIQSGEALYAGASAVGTDSYAVSLTPAITTYTTGMRISFKADVSNTGACTINVNSLGVKNIKTIDWNDPQSSAIRANQIVELVYDWTNFVIQHEDRANTSWVGVVEQATDAEAKVGTSGVYPDNSQIMNFAKKTNIVTGTINFSTSNTTTTIAHWLGVKPKYMIVEMDNKQAAGITGGSATHYDWTIVQKTRNYTDGDFMNALFYFDNGSYEANWAISSVDATNINLTYTNIVGGYSSTNAKYKITLFW